MDCSLYRELLEANTGVDSHKINKLIGIYAQVPSVPKLKATRASLGSTEDGVESWRCRGTAADSHPALAGREAAELNATLSGPVGRGPVPRHARALRRRSGSGDPELQKPVSRHARAPQ